MSDSGSDKALQEFVSEAQEAVESFNRALLRLDEQGPAPGRDPEALNDAFRAVHSLKGISGLFGVGSITRLTHTLESLLDGLRLDRVALSPELLDVLFLAVEELQGMVGRAAQGEAGEVTGDAPRASGALSRIEEWTARQDRAVQPTGPGAAAIDPALLSVLTEYEEHRLRENLRMGRALLRVHASFDLQQLDSGLEELKARLRPVGELITYLPSTDGAGGERIDLDVIIGSVAARADVERALAGLGVTLSEVPGVAAPPAAVAGEELATQAAAMTGDVPAHAMGPLTAGHAAPPLQVAAHPPSAGPPARGDDPHDRPDERPDDRPASLRSVSQTVRVDIRKLDHLLNVAGELALLKAGVQALVGELKVRGGHADLARGLHREVRSLGRRIDELRAGILEVRMVPLGQVFEKLSRVVRRISREAGKEIHFAIAGADTELDKLIVEELSDPLMHVVRNCIDHGIEPAAARVHAGKPPAGRVAITAAHRGNHVVIEVEDDGAGVDGPALHRRALERGYLDARGSAELDEHEVLHLMFLPGLSTRDVADELSGRGVGMDVVKTNISRLSGILDVESERGRGTRITITLPVTLAIIQALIIRAAARTYAVPINAVLETLRIGRGEVRTVERREVITVRGQTLPILRLDDAFGLQRDAAAPERPYAVVVGIAEHRIALVVDELRGRQDIVVKSLGRALDGIRGIAGATELGSRQTVLVLDVAALVEEAIGGGVEAA